MADVGTNSMPGAVKFARAHVDFCLGNRQICDFLASAGLGLTGAGVHQMFTVDYKPGEEVDEARVKCALDLMVAESNRQQTDFKILSYVIQRIELVTV